MVSIRNKNNPEVGVMSNAYASKRKKLQFEFRYKIRARMLNNAIEKYAVKKDNLKVLDYGSAEGLTLLELNNLLKSAQLFGVEYSKELIASNNHLPENIRILHGDVMNLPKRLKQESFDVASALAVLTQLPNQGKAAIEEALDVLKPGGIFVATLPNPCWDKIAIALGLLPGNFSESPMGKRQIVSLIEECGLDVLSYEPFMFALSGFLPYLGLRVPIDQSIFFDKAINKLGILNWGFVNQCVIARKS